MQTFNHNVFRFPAKFHPPAVRSILTQYTNENDTVLDPFCGSGTTLVEASTLGRHSIGTDIDPLSIFITRAKVQKYCDVTLIEFVDTISARLNRMRASDLALWGGFSREITDGEYQAACLELQTYIPELPRLFHWFRKRVVVQLAAIRRLLETLPLGDSLPFFLLSFAAIVRNSSNADPVPVSGLEVTKHMRDKELLGREIDPYSLLELSMKKNIDATLRFSSARSSDSKCRVAQTDSRFLDVTVTGYVDAVVTSPPYLGAVDYFRRHTLEMYWLGLTRDSEARLTLGARYLGRVRVPIRDLGACSSESALKTSQEWLTRFGVIHRSRTQAFHHYCVGISETMRRLDTLVKQKGSIIFVLGNATFSGVPVDLCNLFASLAPKTWTMTDRRWYPVRNRYMSYSRHNGANIDREELIIFRSNR